MKTGLSLPDSLFERAERYAKENEISRSELYRRAIEAYLTAERDRRMAQQVNEYLEKYGDRAAGESDPMWEYVKRVWEDSMGDDEW